LIVLTALSALFWNASGDPDQVDDRANILGSIPHHDHHGGTCQGTLPESWKTDR
jgi:hypothetical protein